MRQDLKEIERTQDPNIFAKDSNGKARVIFTRRNEDVLPSIDSALYNIFMLYNSMCKGINTGRY